jgi:hypothetical protein
MLPPFLRENSEVQIWLTLHFYFLLTIARIPAVRRFSSQSSHRNRAAAQMLTSVSLPFPHCSPFVLKELTLFTLWPLQKIRQHRSMELLETCSKTSFPPLHRPQTICRTGHRTGQHNPGFCCVGWLPGHAVTVCVCMRGTRVCSYAESHILASFPVPCSSAIFKFIQIIPEFT